MLRRGEVLAQMGLHLILWDAFAGLVHKPEVELRSSESLVGPDPIPPERFGVVVVYTGAPPAPRRF